MASNYPPNFSSHNTGIDDVDTCEQCGYLDTQCKCELTNEEN